MVFLSGPGFADMPPLEPIPGYQYNHPPVFSDVASGISYNYTPQPRRSTIISRYAGPVRTAFDFVNHYTPRFLKYKLFNKAWNYGEKKWNQYWSPRRSYRVPARFVYKSRRPRRYRRYRRTYRRYSRRARYKYKRYRHRFKKKKSYKRRRRRFY